MTPREERNRLTGLLKMQMHCGLSGFLFTTIWLVAVYWLLKVPLTYDALWWAPIYFSLFILTWMAGASIPHEIDPDDPSKATETRQKLDHALLKLRQCSVIAVFTIACLIILSGGPNSPFVFFYTMTYTLTLSKIKAPRVDLYAFLFFGSTLFIAFVITYFNWYDGIQLIIPSDVLKKVLSEQSSFVIAGVGAIASLVVPTVSEYIVRKARNKTMKENHRIDESTANFSGGGKA